MRKRGRRWRPPSPVQVPESVAVLSPFPELSCIQVAYLLAVQTARIGLDADELLATDGEAVGEGGVGVSEGRGQGVDVVLGHLQ